MPQEIASSAYSLLGGQARGPVIATSEPLSFWGGVDPATGLVIDVHHPLHGASISGAILVLPGSRGSCTGSGVLLDLALGGRAPAALAFSGPEDVLTLGALVASEMFHKSIPVLRLGAEAFRALSQSKSAALSETALEMDGATIPVSPLSQRPLALSDSDRAMLEGREGAATQQAMRILCAMAVQQGAEVLIDVSQAHIDGCIYASPANLTFAERMADLGAQVRVPTSMNAISVDHANWRAQGVAPSFGAPAAALADAYVRMGCRPTFTCAPYLADTAPKAGDVIGWSESNAVIFANSVLGARTAKHPDFLDLCIAVTGRAPLAGVYHDADRKARRVIALELPAGADESFWPLIGYLAGKAAPDRIPLLTGLAAGAPTRDDLKALCAAFGTSSAAPMLHIEGVTPEAGLAPAPGAERIEISRADLAAAWRSLNDGPNEIDLVAIGSPHASAEECRALAEGLGGRHKHEAVAVVVTAGREVIETLRKDGVLARLAECGVQLLPDLCWCSITEPLFPTHARVVMTNSGKYAHYGPGLSGRAVRFGSLADCVEAALTGAAPKRLPAWLG